MNDTNKLHPSKHLDNTTSEGNKYRRTRCTDSAACTLRQVLSIDNLTKAKHQIEKNSRRMKNRQRAEQQIEECRQWDVGKGRQKILREQYSAAERNLFRRIYERAAERLTESPVITDECTSGSGQVA